MDYLNYAGFGWRLLAHLIDHTLVSIVSIVIGIVVGLLVSIALIPQGMEKEIMKAIAELLSGGLAMIVSWLYYALMESSEWQATLGKKACKIRVTDTDGERISFARASGRYWAKILSGLTCLVGYVMAGFTARKQALHDKIANTLVLREIE